MSSPRVRGRPDVKDNNKISQSPAPLPVESSVVLVNHNQNTIIFGELKLIPLVVLN